MNDSHGPYRPSLRALFSNFATYDAPLGVKLAMALRNNLTKLRRGANCCGRPGQPGC